MCVLPPALGRLARRGIVAARRSKAACTSGAAQRGKASGRSQAREASERAQTWAAQKKALEAQVGVNRRRCGRSADRLRYLYLDSARYL